MNRIILTIALLLATTFASAQTTIPFSDVGCTANRFCSDPAPGVSVLYANAAGAGVVEVFLADGNYYLGTGPVGLSVTQYPVYLQPNTQVPQGSDPAVIYVTATWITWTTAGSGSGRGGYQRHVHWSLTGGELVMY